MKKILIIFVSWISIVHAEVVQNANDKKGNFSITASDLKLTDLNKDIFQIELDTPTIEFVPLHNGNSEPLTLDEFIGLWDPGNTFEQMPPMAILSFYDKEKSLYHAYIKIMTANINNPRTIILTAKSSHPALFKKDAATINLAMLEQAAKHRKLMINLYVDDSPWFPRTNY